MRILGFSKKWDKLQQSQFTTFRFPRKDTDWSIDEEVQIVLDPRSKGRKKLGIARIIEKETKTIMAITEAEAIADGFPNCFMMWLWLRETYKVVYLFHKMNKLTLRWV